MKNYCGIDLHSNNNVIVVIDETDKILLEKKLSNNLGLFWMHSVLYENLLVV
jgi:hypothetical protein